MDEKALRESWFLLWIKSVKYSPQKKMTFFFPITRMIFHRFIFNMFNVFTAGFGEKCTKQMSIYTHELYCFIPLFTNSINLCLFLSTCLSGAWKLWSMKWQKMSLSCSRSATPPHNFHNFNPIHSTFFTLLYYFLLDQHFSQVSLFTIISFPD